MRLTQLEIDNLKVYAEWNRLYSELPSKQRSFLKDVDRTIELVATPSLKKWTQMSDSELKRLSDKDIAKVLAELVPLIEELTARLSEATTLFSRLAELSLIKKLEKVKTHIGQWQDVLIAIKDHPSIKYKEVLLELETELTPALKKKLEKLMKKHTTIHTSVLKTTVEKLGISARGFLKGEPKIFASTEKTAGMLSSMMDSLYKRVGNKIKDIWVKYVKPKVDSVLKDFEDTLDEIDKLIVQSTAKMESKL